MRISTHRGPRSCPFTRISPELEERLQRRDFEVHVLGVVFFKFKPRFGFVGRSMRAGNRCTLFRCEIHVHPGILFESMNVRLK